MIKFLKLTDSEGTYHWINPNAISKIRCGINVRSTVISLTDGSTIYVFQDIGDVLNMVKDLEHD